MGKKIKVTFRLLCGEQTVKDKGGNRETSEEAPGNKKVTYLLCARHCVKYIT